MVGLKDGEVVTGPPSGDLFAGMGGSVKPPKRTPAQAKKAFQIPSDVPTDYVPPEYQSINGRKRIALDIEGLDPDLEELGPGAHRENGKVVGVAIGLSDKPQDANYYPTGHDNGPNVEDPDKFYDRLRDEAAQFEGEMVGTNLQYDLDWLRARHGVVFPRAKFRDVQIAAPLLDENRLTYKLGVLSKHYLNKDKTDEDLHRLYGGGYIANMHLVHPGHAAIYGQGDVSLPWEIMDKQIPLLEREGLMELFDIESRLTPLLLEMRHRGVRIELGKAQESYDRIKEEQAAIERQKSSRQWTKDDGQYIPNPSTWLNQERWEDEPEPEVAAPKSEIAADNANQLPF